MPLAVLQYGYQVKWSNTCLKKLEAHSSALEKVVHVKIQQAHRLDLNMRTAFLHK